jgi:DNA-binding NarL/FixJ family response regulator
MAERGARIFIIDDHPLVREWLRALISQEPDFHVCGEAPDAARALEDLASTKPDLAIIDISLKGSSSGIELIKQIKDRYPKVAMLVLSMHEEASHAERAVRAGAQGYVMKTESTQRVVDAIRDVLSGKIYLSDRVTRLFVSKFVYKKAPAFGASTELLSDRELEVSGLLGQGFETQEIARKLELSSKTVHSYYGRIREKLSLRSSTQLLLEAVRWHEGSPVKNAG